MTHEEQEALTKLQDMLNNKQYIAMSLWPPVGSSMIEKYDNRLFINEGRDGRYDRISCEFYDSIVGSYDSRARSERFKNQKNQL